MIREEVTYTIAAMDRTGKNVIVYLKPNYASLSEVYRAIRQLTKENPLGDFKVVVSSTQILTFEQIKKLVDESVKKA